MPNSNHLETQSIMLKEVIPTNDSKQENRYFFLTMGAVLWLAAFLLWASNHSDKAPSRLPNHLSNLATQLSIASDEIAMLQEVELLGTEPTLNELIDNQLEPFASETVVMAGANCFVIDKQQVSLRLLKSPEQPWQVQWRDNSADHGHEHHSNNSELCAVDDSWLAAAHLSN